MSKKFGMARLKNFRHKDEKESTRVESICQDLSWPRGQLKRMPWILVVGPTNSGKTTFIQKAIQLLGGQSRPDTASSDSTSSTKDWKWTTSQSTVLFKEFSITGHLVEASSEVQQLIRHGGNWDCESDEVAARPSYVLMVLKTEWQKSGNSTQTRRKTVKEHMLEIKRTVSAIGLPSCLVLTEAQRILGESGLVKIAKSNKNVNQLLNGVEVLGMQSNRVFPVESTPKGSLKKPGQSDELYLMALEGLAVDFKQQINQTVDFQTRTEVEERQMLEEQEGKCARPSPSTSDTCKTCEKCNSLTDAHVFFLRVDINLDQNRPKVPPEELDKFYRFVNGLLNTLEGGTICLHLDSRLHDIFRDQTSNKLSELLPTGNLYADTYVFRTDDNHIFFAVKTAGKGGRSLSTLDFKIMLSRDVGLKHATHAEVLELLKRVQLEQEEYPYKPVDDPKFVSGHILPHHFGENSSRQMKSYQKDDIERYVRYRMNGDRSNKAAQAFSSMLSRYICAFALLKTGGILYLGLSEQKELKPELVGQKLAGDRDEDYIRPGLFRCDGIELHGNKRRDFEAAVKKEVEGMPRFPQESKFTNVEVSFLPVIGGCLGTKLCVVKISVKYFHGIIWPQGHGPVAYKVKRRQSDIVPIEINEWMEAFNQ